LKEIEPMTRYKSPEFGMYLVLYKDFYWVFVRFVMLDLRSCSNVMLRESTKSME
jgi:hypothetical protein